MKRLLDLNLSSAWVPMHRSAGSEAVHWSTVGAAAAADAAIMAWTKGNGFTLITNDLDFNAILAATRAEGPSVVQIRAQTCRRPHSGRRCWPCWAHTPKCSSPAPS